MNFNKYIGIPYKEYARGPDSYDCWGLVRVVASEVFNHELPCLTDLNPDDKRAITRTAQQLVLSKALTVKPTPSVGAIAAGCYGGVCVHVGIVVEADGRMWVLEADTGTNSRLLTLDKFAQPFERVDYYVET